MSMLSVIGSHIVIPGSLAMPAEPILAESSCPVLFFFFLNPLVATSQCVLVNWNYNAPEQVLPPGAECTWVLCHARSYLSCCQMLNVFTRRGPPWQFAQGPTRVQLQPPRTIHLTVDHRRFSARRRREDEEDESVIINRWSDYAATSDPAALNKDINHWCHCRALLRLEEIATWGTETGRFHEK